MTSIRRLTFGILVLAVVWMAAGCAGNQLQDDDIYPDTPEFKIADDSEITDTPENRQVLEMLHDYREALVAKNFGALRRMISEDYYDNAGTTDTTSDDYGYEELSEIFELMANHAEEVRYSVVVRNLEIDGKTAHVDFEYDYAYRYRMADSDTWDAGREVSRLQLQREDDQWKIISGL